MVRLHNLLERQVQKHFGDASSIPNGMESFIQAVNSTYQDYDLERGLLERSLDLTSQEHLAYNTQMQKVREIAIGIDSKNTLDDIFSFTVESAKEIEGIGFVLVQKLDESGQYIITPYYSSIANETDKKIMSKIGIPLERVLGISPTSKKLKFKLARMKVAQDYLNNPRVIVKEKLSELLDGTWPKPLCDSIQSTFGYKRFVITPLLVNGQSWGNLLFWLKSHVPNTVLETITAHCSLGIKNVLAMDVLKMQNIELLESEKKYRLITDNTADYIAVVNTSGKYNYVSPSHIHLGYNEKDLIGKSFYELLHPEDKAQVISIFSQFTRMVLQNKIDLKDQDVSRIVTFRFKGSSGGWYFMESNISLMKADNTRALNILLVSRDLTEKKNNENILKESEERYRSIFNSANDIILLIDNKGIVLDVNKKIQEIAGYNPGELIGKNILSLNHILPAKSLATIGLNFGKRLMGIHIPTYEVEMIKNNGEKAYVEISAKVIKKGNEIIGDLAILRDISERRKSEYALRTQKDLIDRILMIAPSAILVLDSELNIVLANKAFQKDMFDGNDPEGQSIQDVLKNQSVIDAVKEVISGKENENKVEFIQSSITGEKIYIASALNMESDQVLLIINDVTTEREKQNRLYLTDRLASVGEMASGIAHELNNPLTSIISITELLTEEELPPEPAEDIRSVCQEAKRASRIVKNMLSFARRHEPNRQSIKIDDVLNDVLKIRAYEQKVGNIVVTMTVSSNLPMILVDYYQMQQVFLNIILNAEQAMIEAHGRGNLEIKTEVKEGFVRIVFSDDGPGIRPENTKRIFDPFFTTKEVGKGTGLGLSICYGIITAHGGKIYVESEYGKGATFVVELPIQDK